MAITRHGIGVLWQFAHECWTLKHLELVLAPRIHLAWLQHAGAVVRHGGSLFAVAEVTV